MSIATFQFGSWDPAKQMLTGGLETPSGEFRHWCFHTEFDSWRLSVALSGTPKHVWSNRTGLRFYLDFVDWQAWGPFPGPLPLNDAHRIIRTVLTRYCEGAPSGRMLLEDTDKVST